MKNAAIVKYLSKKPCVICSSKTRIEAVNDAGMTTGKLFVGDLLAPSMSPLDVLKIEASVKSAFPQATITVSTSALFKNGFAVVYFEEMLGRYFAIVAFYRTLEECKRATAKDPSQRQPAMNVLEKLIDDLVDIPDKGFSRRDDIGLFRAAELIERAVKDISDKSTFFDCDVTFECSPFMKKDVYFSGIGLHSFLKALSLIMYAVNDLSCDRQVSIYTTAAGADPQIHFRTVTKRTTIPAKDADALAEQAPTAGAALILADYIAGTAGFDLSAESDSDGGVTVSLRRNYDDVPGLEFKCRDPYDGYEDSLPVAVELLDGFQALYEQKQNQH